MKYYLKEIMEKKAIIKEVKNKKVGFKHLNFFSHLAYRFVS